MFGGKLPRGAGGPRNGGGPQHLVQVGEVVPRPGRSGLAVQVGRSEPSEAESCAGGEDESHRAQAAPSRLGNQENQPVSAARVVSAGEPGDGSPHLTRATAPQEASPQAPAQSPQAALLRTLHAQPDVADRYLHLPAGRQERLPHRLYRRSLPLRGRAGRVSQPDGGARVRGVPPGGGGVRRAQRDALRSRSPILELARHHPFRGGVAQGSGSPH